MEAFLSHSSKDEKIVNSIFRICQRTKIKPNIAEFEEIERGKLGAKEIRGMIDKSDLFFLFLSEHVVDDKDYAKTVYTQNWVNFELGCAYAQKKEKKKFIFVFEPFKQLRFPIPYLDYYVLFDPDYNPHWDYIEDLLGQERDFRQAEKNPIYYAVMLVYDLSERLKGHRLQRPSERYGHLIQHRECGAKYTLLSKPQQWLCPVCRRPTDWMP
jgi:hypothetical protein